MGGKELNMYANDMGEGSKFTFLRDSHTKEITNLEVTNDLKEIEEIFRIENENLDGWRLEEIPTPGCYCFTNNKEYTLNYGYYYNYTC